MIAFFVFSIAACREYDSYPGNEPQSPSIKGTTNYFNAKWFKQGNLKMTTFVCLLYDKISNISY